MTELGNRLKEARLAKDMSLDDLQAVTKIQKRYLIGIEEGNYSMMPGKFYVRAFIKQYAEAVGIEPEELFEQFKSDIPSTINEDIPEKLSRVQTRQNVSTGRSKVFDMLPKILITIFVIGALAVAYTFFQKSNDGGNSKEPVDSGGKEPVRIEESDDFAKDTEKDTEQDSNEDSTKPEDQTTEDDTVEEETEAPKQEVTAVESSGKKTVYELKNTDRFELKVVSTGETWVNILNGKGTSFFSGTLKKGENESQVIDFSKEIEAVLVIGKSTETEIYVNDEKVEYAIPPTQSVTQNITIRYLPTNE
ncbi:helix-turn-helix domain-containing protein [Cytobacillus massiliigabonensis]|uniref:helix-turn-helix domain-containing protein n=1 Tax=Cytobacillus massiliigabonensis TaxID=1871011 RepID=UPI000C865305|nr:RodZ domain-containing protein [Cytobacillus massiliigabonensis]